MRTQQEHGPLETCKMIEVPNFMHFFAKDVCHYLEAPRTSVSECILFSKAPDRCFYSRNIVQGWRRYGNMLYRMRCPDCRLCTPLRIHADSLVLTSSLRRILSKNRDLRIVRRPAEFDSSHYQLWTDYSRWKHGLDFSQTTEEIYRDFLCPWGIMFEYQTGDKAESTVAVSIIDPLEDGLSSVYFFFSSAAARRSPGFFSILAEAAISAEPALLQEDSVHAENVVQWYSAEPGSRCKALVSSHNLRNSHHSCKHSQACSGWYYLGYWIPGARTMDYKARIAPFELALPARAAMSRSVHLEWVRFESRTEAVRHLASLARAAGSIPQPASIDAHVDYSPRS